jgi:hypothetical protein
MVEVLIQVDELTGSRFEFPSRMPPKHHIDLEAALFELLNGRNIVGVASN